MAKTRSICVYCGSHPGKNPAYMQAARILGTCIADAGIKLVYGGGTQGIMGEIADAVLDSGGYVTGIIPKFLIGYESCNKGTEKLSELIITKNMHERKQAMFDRSDAFVTLPGGIGTLEEIVEIMTWAQLGRHEKPMVLANIEGYWNNLFSQLDVMREGGFLHSQQNLKPLIIDDASEIVDTILKA